MQPAATGTILEFIFKHRADTAWALATLAVEPSELPEAVGLAAPMVALPVVADAMQVSHDAAAAVFGALQIF